VRRFLLSLILLAGVIGSTLPAAAVQPDEVLDDPALETRARDLSAGLRCLVCQNQSIDDSDADFARDLRLLVRERLLEGDSDTEVIDYVVARYGDFVLLKPPFNWSTALLWGMPAVVLLVAGGFAVGQFRRRAVTATGAGGLSAEEEAEVRRLMASDAAEEPVQGKTKEPGN